MPLEQDLPQQKAPWRPDPARAVLLIHDMQAYFIDPFPRGQPPLTDLVSNIRRLRRVASALGVPVAYTAQPGGMTRTERGIQHDIWGPGMTAAPRHRGIIDEVAPTNGDTVLTKWRYSAFYGTGLQNLLDAKGRDQLIICGVYAHLGCMVTAFDAFMRDIEPFFVADAVADFSFEKQWMAVNYVTSGGAVAVWTRSLIAALMSQTRTELAESAAHSMQAR
jgi:bifunctional isochorismate lyase/aryl carrier protein